MAYKVEAGDLCERVEREVSVILSPEVPLDEKTWDAIDVAAPVIAGHIEGAAVWDVTDLGNEILVGADEGFPVSLPLGTPIECSAIFCNDSDVDLLLRTEMEIIDPDGIVVVSASPGFLVSAGWCYERRTPDCVLDKAGTWKFHAILKEGVIP